MLPAKTKIHRVKHHKALPYAEIPQFMSELRERDGVSARALEFTILSATRTNESIGARWSEIDLKDKTWTIPGERMKSKRPHRVPLSDRALAILKTLPREGEFVFPGGTGKKAALKHGTFGNGQGHNRQRLHDVTASVPASAIGARSKPTFRARLQNWRWRMS